MEYDSKITITNSSDKSKIFCIEPWAEEFEMLPEITFDVLVMSDEKGDFEVDFGENRITVYTWWNSTAKVLYKGENICKAGHIKFPGPIGKMNLSDTIKWLFGKNVK